MEPEKFMIHTEFKALLKAAKDDRERCILLLMAGAGLRVGEITQIKAEGADFNKGYLHVQAINAKFKKPRTLILLPQVAEAIAMHLNGRSKSWLFPSYREGHISPRQVQNILDGIATKAGLQEAKRKDKAGKDRHRIHPPLFRHGFAIWSLDNGVPVGDHQDQLGHVSLSATGIYIPYYRNYPIGEYNENVEHAIIVIHGMKRIAGGYYQYMCKAAQKSNSFYNTIILTPYFKTEEDRHKLDELYWSESAWKKGDRFTQNRPARVSSFAVIDEILSKLVYSGNFPNLKDIVIIGHSAGGQFVQRFSCGSRAKQGLHIPIRYIVSLSLKSLYISSKHDLYL